MGIDATNNCRSKRNANGPSDRDGPGVKARVDAMVERIRNLTWNANRSGVAASSPPYDRNNRVLEIEFDNGSIIQHTPSAKRLRSDSHRPLAPPAVYKDTILRVHGHSA